MNHESFSKDYKPKKMAGAFDDKYMEYISEYNEQLSIQGYLENIRS